jgi:hypothetical protein
MKYQVKDIVRTVLEYGDRLFAIVRLDVGRYYAVALTNKKRYWLEESQIKCKEGTIPDNSPLLLLDDAYDHADGAYFAQQKALFTANDTAKRWSILAALKPGDKVDVVVNKFIHSAEFMQINTRKPVKVFRARVLGRALDLPLEAVYLGEK